MGEEKADIPVDSKEKDDQLSAQSESTDNPPNPATNEQTENESNQDSQTKSPNEESDQKDGTSQKKRKNDFKDANRSKKKSKDDVEIRFLISNKQAGLLIGKKGANITFLRQHFNSSVIITDCAGPERVLSVTVHESQVDGILASIIGYLEEKNQNSNSELRLLLHTNVMGSLIGKKGSKLKDIRQKNNTSVKIFPQCCPRSSERVCIIEGQPANVISCIRNILEIAFSNQTVGKTFFYNPANYVPDVALNYGGFPLEPSIKNRNFRGNQRAINQGPKGKRTYGQSGGFNQPEVWSQNPQSYYVDDWSQASNPMANANYQIANQQSQLTNYQQPNNFNQQSAVGYQQSGSYPQQNVPYYLDPSGFASGTNSQLYNSNDLMGGSLNQLNSAGSLGTAALSTNQIKTFWSSYYSDNPNNLTVPINVDGRVNMT